MKLTIPKILAGGVAMFTLMFVFALTRVETAETKQTRAMHEVKEVIAEAVNVAFDVPDEVKAWAIKRGYQLNGNSMVGSGIDLTSELPTGWEWGKSAPDNMPVPVRKVPTTRIIPEARAEDKNEIDQAADEPVRQIQAQAPVETNTCTRHGMRKITTQDGKSWHCRKR